MLLVNILVQDDKTLLYLFTSTTINSKVNHPLSKKIANPMLIAIEKQTKIEMDVYQLSNYELFFKKKN